MYPIEISWIAIIVATVLAQAVGFIWYSPTIFFKKWAELSGFGENDINDSKGKGMAKILTISILSTLVMAYVMSNLIVMFVVVTYIGAIKLAFWMWLGFIATTTIHDFLWSPKPKPWALYFLNNGQALLALIVMSVALHYFLP